MKRAAKVDANQKQIVTALRQAGCTVQSLATVGKGCPDLIVGCQGRNFLLEIKDGSKPPSARQLTEDQQTWHQNWRGQVVVVESVVEVLHLLGKVNK